ncbi:MAG: hypothetical protein P4L50_02830 [Anaerolineaceae bacterium]|nr:hypothetical protein [Anaerolineaceae bacterium]
MLEQAILKTVAYADVFDYPLTLSEIQRYLIGEAAAIEKTRALLQNGCLIPYKLSSFQNHFTLPGRERIVSIRQERAAAAEILWPRAIYYGQQISKIPFVRMVALTGALAMRNVDPGADLDYLIVTEPGRLWVSRALVIILVKIAARQGVIVCPNYFVSENALVIKDRNIFTAHELAQMVVIAGQRIFDRMLAANRWITDYLPNAWLNNSNASKNNETYHQITKIGEIILRSPMGAWLENWEMGRKIRKFNLQSAEHPEANFSADWCKGHFDDHGSKILSAYQQRLFTLEE